MLTLRATLKTREGDSSGRPHLGVQIGKVTEDLAKTVGFSGRRVRPSRGWCGALRQSLDRQV